MDKDGSKLDQVHLEWPEEQEAPRRENRLSRILVIIGWVIFAVCVAGVAVLMATDSRGYAIGFALFLIYPLLMLVATVVATAGSRNGVWVALAGLVFEVGVIIAMMGGTFDMGTVGVYGAIDLVASLVGWGVGTLMRRHFENADPR
ncbi:MAG: hypothetical protein UHD09_00770 [Bifidobacterium sp.]|nr:hypothetical protein [Bifidobacterium sp.]